MRSRVPLSCNGYRIDTMIHSDSLETVISTQIYLAYALEGSSTGKPLILKHIPLKSLGIHIECNSLHLGRIYHDNILTTIECFYENEDLWVVMPYFEGVSLKSIISQLFHNGITNKTLVNNILFHVLLALDRIHACSSALKSLKPSKILIDVDGNIKVLDCEISKRIREELCKKKLLDMYWSPPEVMNGLIADPRGDIWSFGVLIYEILTGKNPWEGYPVLKTSIMITDKPSPKLERCVDCDPYLRELVNLCLQKDPQKRPTSIALLEDAYFRRVIMENSYVAHSIRKVFKIKDRQNKKLEPMPQPKQLSGEDPDEMLISEEDD